jgi:hypothetical protein
MEDDPIITFEAAVRCNATPAQVYEVLADPSSHLEWAGDQAPAKAFRLLTLDAPTGVASVGTTFTSIGAGSKSGAMTFHDRSTVTEAKPHNAFGFETDSRLVRKHRPTWEARSVHRYTVTPDGSATRVHYTCAVYPQNYRPYWLHPLMRPLSRRMVGRAIRRNMEVMARVTEEEALAAEDVRP